MKFRDKNSIDRTTGAVFLTISETGVGKTCTGFQTLPKPIAVLTCEARDAEQQAIAAGIPAKDYDIADYTTAIDMIDFLGHRENFTRFASIMLDGLSQLMENVAEEVSAENVDMRSNDEKKKDQVRELTELGKLSMEGYGAMANLMKRIVRMCNSYSHDGKIVVLNTLGSERKNTWNNTVELVPTLMGKDFPSFLPGMIDFIGVLQKRYEYVGPNGDIIRSSDYNETVHSNYSPRILHPPEIWFENGPGTNFMCKWAGPRPQGFEDGIPIHGPLNYTGIVERFNEMKRRANKIDG